MILDNMTLRTKIIFTVGFLVAVMIGVAVWWTGSDGRGGGRDAAAAWENGCFSRSVELIENGETELGEESLELCRRSLALQGQKLGTFDWENERIRFDGIVKDWTPVWPGDDENQTNGNGGKAQPMSKSEIESRIKKIDTFILNSPQSYFVSPAIILKGMLLYQEGSYSECVEWLMQNNGHRGFEVLPTYSRNLIARAAVKAGLLELATEQINRLEVEFPGTEMTGKALLLKAEILAEQGRLRSAMNVLWRVARGNFPPIVRGQALLEAAKIYNESDQPEYAVTALTEIARLYPKANVKDHLLDYIDVENGSLTMKDRILLADYYKKVEKGYPIQRLLSPVKNKLPPEGKLLLANGYFLAGKYGSTRTVLRGLGPDAPRDVLAQACMLRGESIIKQKNWSGAAGHLEACLKKFPSMAKEYTERLVTLYGITGDDRRRAELLIALSEAEPGHEKEDEHYLNAARWFLTSGDHARAEEIYNVLISRYPRRYSAAEALFWLGKLRMYRDDMPGAIEKFTQLRERFPYSYFYYRAGRILVQNGYAMAAHNSHLRPDSNYSIFPGTSQRLRDGNALRHMHLYDDALYEFENALELYPREATVGISRVYRALNNMPSSVKRLEEMIKVDPKFYAAVMGSDELTELLFPTMFLDAGRREAARYGMNPAWPFSIIRQESRFKPDATSWSNAKGLMQIIPSTGRWIAQKLNVRPFYTNSLYKPQQNIPFGTWYFSHLLETFDGNAEYAVGAYNGGPGNMRKWIAKYDTSDIDMFIESIPRDESRGYIKKVMLNYYIYSALLQEKQLAERRD